MSRLIFNSAEIVDTSGASFSTSGEAVIKGIVVDSIELTKEPTTVEIEDGRTLNESFAGSVTVRTINTTTVDSGNADTNDGVAIFSVEDDSGNVVVSSNGSLPAAKAGLKLVGDTSVTIAPCYIMAHRDFSNGRVETVIMATAESVQESIVSAS